MNSLDTDYLLGTAVTVAGATIGVTLDSHIRNGQSILENCTTAKVQRAALYAIATLVPVITALVLRNGTSTLISLLGSAACIFGASNIRDYEDTKELQLMKTAAEGMHFRDLVNTHGLNNVVKYKIVEDLQAKFSLAFSEQTFSSILKEYSLEKIRFYQLAPLTADGFLHDKFVHELSARKWDFLRVCNFSNPLYTNLMSSELFVSLTNLSNDLENIDQVYSQRLSDLDIAYSERTEVQLKKFAERERNIPYLARHIGEQVTSRATNDAFGNAVFNAVVWDGSTDHLIRDTSAGYNVAEAAGKYAEQAELERLRAELQRDRSNPILIARGAAEQNAYDLGVAQAKQERAATIALQENTLAEILLRI